MGRLMPEKRNAELKEARLSRRLYRPLATQSQKYGGRQLFARELIDHSGSKRRRVGLSGGAREGHSAAHKTLAVAGRRLPELQPLPGRVRGGGPSQARSIADANAGFLALTANALSDRGETPPLSLWARAMGTDSPASIDSTFIGRSLRLCDVKGWRSPARCAAAVSQPLMATLDIIMVWHLDTEAERPPWTSVVANNRDIFLGSEWLVRVGSDCRFFKLVLAGSFGVHFSPLRLGAHPRRWPR